MSFSTAQGYGPLGYRTHHNRPQKRFLMHGQRLHRAPPLGRGGLRLGLKGFLDRMGSKLRKKPKLDFGI